MATGNWAPEQVAAVRQWRKCIDADKGSDARVIFEKLRGELGVAGWEALRESGVEYSLYRESEQSPNRQETGPEQFAAPIRKEDWIQSEDYPGIWVNSSGEVMDGATRKVRTLSTSFNPRTRKFSTRVWLNTEHGYCYHQNLLTERERLRKATYGKQALFPYSIREKRYSIGEPALRCGAVRPSPVGFSKYRPALPAIAPTNRDPLIERQTRWAVKAKP